MLSILKYVFQAYFFTASMCFKHIFLLPVPSPGKGGGLRQVDSRPKTFVKSQT